MAAIKIKAELDASVWEALEKQAKESDRSVSELLTEAIRDDLRRCRVREVALGHLEDSIATNETLGKLLTR